MTILEVKDETKRRRLTQLQLPRVRGSPGLLLFEDFLPFSRESASGSQWVGRPFVYDVRSGGVHGESVGLSFFSERKVVDGNYNSHLLHRRPTARYTSCSTLTREKMTANWLVRFRQPTEKPKPKQAFRGTTPRRIRSRIRGSSMAPRKRIFSCGGHMKDR